MMRLGVIALAAMGLSAAALAQEVDIPKAVDCTTLSQWLSPPATLRGAR
jgi:hypothetical protein